MSGMTGAIAEAVGMGLLNFTWMGFLLGAVLGLILSTFRRRSPRLRYGVALTGFLLLSLTPLATIGNALNAVLPMASLAPGSAATTDAMALPVQRPIGALVSGEISDGISDTSVEISPAAPAGAFGFVHMLGNTQSAMRVWLDQTGRVLHAAAPWLTLGWAAGVLLFGLRLLGGAWFTRSLRWRGTASLEARWQARLEQLCAGAGIKRAVCVLQSTATAVPLVVGWLRPVILMPAAVFTGLTPHQVELLLAHELAHIRRLDPLVNLLQAMVETLLFFHPVVWWLSRRIREERELCCDDFALSLCGGRVAYAQALLQIAETSLGAPSLALSSQGSPLRRRVNRILGMPPAPGRLSAPGVLALTLLGVLCAATSALAWVEVGNLPEQQTRPVRAETPVGGPRPARDASAFQRDDAPLDATIAVLENKNYSEPFSFPAATAQPTANAMGTAPDFPPATLAQALPVENAPEAVIDQAPSVEAEEPFVTVGDTTVDPPSDVPVLEQPAPEADQSLAPAKAETAEQMPHDAWPDLAGFEVSDQIAGEHLSSVLERWGKQFHLYFHLDPHVVVASGKQPRPGVEIDGMTAARRLDRVPLDDALAQVLEPLGLAYWYGQPENTQKSPIHPSVWVSTPAVLESIRTSTVQQFRFDVTLVTLDGATRAECLSNFAPPAGDGTGEQFTLLSFLGEEAPEHGALPIALEAFLDQRADVEVHSSPHVTTLAGNSWWWASARAALISSPPDDKDGLREGGCLYGRNKPGIQEFNPFADGMCGTQLTVPPSVKVNCEDRLLPFATDWLEACTYPALIADMTQVFDPPIVSPRPQVTKRAGRREANLPRPAAPSPENPVEVSLYHQGVLLGLGALQREHVIEVQFFSQYRLEGVGPEDWRGFFTRYATQAGSVYGFFMPVEGRDKYLLALIRVTPAEVSSVALEKPGVSA
jgi:beta-lactamase regulating signal transducer with metallopeptidase domain